MGLVRGVVVQQDDGIEETFTVTERAHGIADDGRRILIATPGMVLPVSRARELGILPGDPPKRSQATKARRQSAKQG